MKLLFAPGLRILTLTGLFVSHGVYAALPQGAYDALIRSTKGEQSAAQLVPVIEQLQAWQRAEPDSARIIYDLAVLLNRAEKYAEAFSYYPRIVRAEAPAYAIKAVAHAARLSSRHAEAEAAYRLLISKTPADIEAHVGLVYAWVKLERVPQAYEYVRQYLPAPAGYTVAHIPMIVALAELHELRNEWLDAASAYQAVLQLNPVFRYALRGQVFALGHAGLPYLAKRYADLQPTAFSPDEKYQIAHDAAAMTIRFGEAQLAAESKRSRVTTIDIALTENSALSSQFGDLARTDFDRMVALRDRGHMQQVVRLHAALAEAKIAMPAYVKFAAADAYLFLQQPERARDLYLSGLDDVKTLAASDVLNTQISLVYAYYEAEQHTEAEVLAARLLRDQPQRIFRGMPGLDAPNPDYSQAYVLTILLQIYSDRLALAEKQLSSVRLQAPFNNDVRAAWASLQASREHPRTALEEFTLMLVDDPNAIGAAVGRNEMLLSLNEFAQAKILLPPLLADAPESKAVQNLARRMANYERPFYRIDATFGQGASGSGSGADALVDAALYSAPLTTTLGDRFRVFSHVARTQGEADSQTFARTRVGIGLDYRSRDVEVEAEINRALGDSQASGIALALSWHLSDAWHAQAQLDTNVNDLPAAALRNGVTAEGVKLGLTWVLHESRKAGAELASTHFSDGNIRDRSRIWWQERWISGPIFKFASTLGLAASRNSQGGRDYFNPSGDTELDLDLRAEWLSWRRYERSFKQRVGVTLGQYWQNGFAPGTSGALRYEHEWRYEDELELRYGVGRSFHPYDGNRDYRNYVYLYLSGRIK